ncbi:MAG: DUF4435 domain-containing protein [Nostoc sp.]
MKWSGKKGVAKTIDSYIIELKFSTKKHLLVEGNSDKALFERLFTVLSPIYEKENNKKLNDEIFIDDADFIENNPGLEKEKLGNWEKIEVICEKIQNEPIAKRFVGFVDRDFRGFNICDNLQDELDKHNIQGRLIWSRGHSIENYFFDYLILRDALSSLSPINWLEDVINNFEKVLESTIRLACAVSLAARETELLDKVKHTVHREIIDIDIKNLNINLKTDDWENFLTTNQHISADQAANFIHKYQSWHLITQKANFSVIRWLCHGHIGMLTVLAVYLCCVEEIGKKEAKVVINRKDAGIYDEITIEKQINAKKQKMASSKVKSLQQRINEEHITHACSYWWTTNIITTNRLIYPLEILNLFDINLF